MNKLSGIQSSFIKDGMCQLESVMPGLSKQVLRRWLALTVLGAVVLPAPVQALNIQATYDSSVTGLTNAAQVEAAFGAAVQTIEDLYTNPITVNITVSFSSGVSLGQSDTLLTGNPSYTDLVNALRASRTTAEDTNSVASLPASDPTSGPWWIPRAEAKALGPIGYVNIQPNDPGSDGSVTFSSTVSYTLDPNKRVVAGKYDFIGVAEHEITEVLGRIPGLDYGISGYVPYDLFRFTGYGVRSTNANDSSVYFSLDDGLTSLKNFNPNNGGDVQDWRSSSTPDSFDAYASAGHELILSSADLTALDILGYDLNFAAPQVTGARLSNGSFQITFTSTPGMGFVVWASSDISSPLGSWTKLGAPTEISAGQYQFTDSQAPKNQERFYRISLP